MPKPIPTKEIARRCLVRIRKWQAVPSFAEVERDYTFFTSAFPEYELRLDEIMRGLHLLEAAGYISLEFTQPHAPEVFRVRYLEEVVPA